MKHVRSILARLARIGLLLLAFYPLLRMLQQNWDSVVAAFQGMDWLRFSISLLALMAVLPWMASISWVCVHALGARLPARQVFGLYFITQLPKYLPGGIWAFPGRMVAYSMVGIPDSYAILSVFREVAALVLGAAMVGCLALLWQGEMDGSMLVVITFAIAASLFAIRLLHWPAFWKFLQASPLAKSKLFSRLLQGDLDVLTSLSWLPGSLLCSLSFWLVMGIPFSQLARALSPENPLTWLEAAAVFALSWTAGFVVILVPAGFGVRESALSYLLLPFMSAGAAASVALLSRLWWMAIEAVMIGLSIWFIGSPRTWLGHTPEKTAQSTK